MGSAALARGGRRVLSIGKLTGSDSDRYYTRTVAARREDSYAGRGEAPGCWTGSRVDLLIESDQEVRPPFRSRRCGRASGALEK